MIAVNEHLIGKHVVLEREGAPIQRGRIMAVAFDANRMRFVFLVATDVSRETRFETWGDEEVRMQ